MNYLKAINNKANLLYVKDKLIKVANGIDDKIKDTTNTIKQSYKETSKDVLNRDIYSLAIKVADDKIVNNALNGVTSTTISKSETADLSIQEIIKGIATNYVSDISEYLSEDYVSNIFNVLRVYYSHNKQVDIEASDDELTITLTCFNQEEVVDETIK